MRTFQLEMCEMCAHNIWFSLKYVRILGIGDWRLSRKTCEMCAFRVKYAHFERPLPDMVILWVFFLIFSKNDLNPRGWTLATYLSFLWLGLSTMDPDRVVPLGTTNGSST